MKKEELISELLLSHPRPAVPYSAYDKPVVLRNDVELSEGLFTGTHASKKGFYTGDRPRTLHDKDIRCALNSVPESDLNATSPRVQGEVRISHIYPENGFSARDRLTTMTECHDNDVGCSFNCVPEFNISATSREQQAEARISYSHIDNGFNVGDRPTVPNCYDNDLDQAFNFDPDFSSGASSPQGQTEVRMEVTYTAPDQSLARLQRSKSRQKALEIRNSAKAAAKSRYAPENLTGACYSGNKMTRMVSQQIDHDIELFGLANYSDTIRANSAARQAVGECQGTAKNPNTDDGRITRSRSSCNLSGRESIAKEDGCPMVSSQSISTKGTSKPVSSSYTASQRVTRSKSGASRKPPLDNLLNRMERFRLQNVPGGEVVPHCPDSSAIVNQDGNADNILETEVISDGLLEAQAAISESNLDLACPSVRFEACVSRPPIFGMFVKPKTLDFGDIEECLNKISGPMLEMGRLEKSAASHDKITFSNTSGRSLVKQSLEPNASNNKTDAWRVSSETCVEECVVHDEDVSNNLMHVTDKSKSVQEIQNSLVSDGSDKLFSSAGKGFDEKHMVQIQEVIVSCL